VSLYGYQQSVEGTWAGVHLKDLDLSNIGITENGVPELARVSVSLFQSKFTDQSWFHDAILNAMEHSNTIMKMVLPSLHDSGSPQRVIWTLKEKEEKLIHLAVCFSNSYPFLHIMSSWCYVHVCLIFVQIIQQIFCTRQILTTLWGEPESVKWTNSIIV